MRRAVVVGGGFAGFAAAIDLARRGLRVTLVEARRSAGGRASSFVDPRSGETIDNGQHVLVGGYRATRAFLGTLGTDRLLRFQKRLEIPMAEPDGKLFRLACPPLPSPAHLVAGLLAMAGLGWRDRLALLKAGPRLLRTPGGSLTVEAWLDALGQTEELRDRFWRPVMIAALNEDTRTAAASLMVNVMRETFTGGAGASALGWPVAGWSDLYVEPGTRYLRERGGDVLTGAVAERIEMDGGRAAAVRLRHGAALPCDAAVLAVPHAAAGRLLPAETVAADPRLGQLADLGASPIVSVNLWLDRAVMHGPLIGFHRGRIQFLFNKADQFDPAHAKGTYLAGVVSAAAGLAAASNDAIADAAVEDVRRYLPAARGARVLRTMVVRDRAATFSGRPATLRLRPGPRTAVPNLFLAGDWTDTGLPGTIEGAVRSGLAAAAAALPA